MATSNNGSAFVPNMTETGQVFTKVPIGTIVIAYTDFELDQLIQTYRPISGQIVKLIGDPIVNGINGPAFDIDLRNGDYIMFAGATPDTTQINQVINIIRPDQMEVDAGIVPIAGDVDYNGVNCFVFDNQPPLTRTSEIIADPTTVVPTQMGNRFFYSEFYGWNWNTNAIENLAQTRATAVGGDLWDLGWEDEAGWITATSTLLSEGGWNATITNVAPDPTTIDNSNQEIVLYYTTGTLTFNGNLTNVIDTISFIEQSNVLQNYSQELGAEPFKSTTSNTMMQVSFNPEGLYGFYVPSPDQVIPNPVALPNSSIPAQQGFASDSVLIATLTSSYDATSSFTLEDKDFEKGQFQVFVKYTTYDGIEAVVAKKLVEMGISVNPENVNWYVKEMQDRGDLEEIEWPFDDEEEAPVEENPETFDPTSESPLDYIPENRKQEEGEEDAN